MKGKLWGMRAYLCGPMDKALDGGIGWRRKAVEWLEARGCVPFDPTDKPIALGGETADDRERRQRMLEEGRMDELVAEIKQLRCVDLRMVDITDFTIVHLDMEAKPCGTFEELFLANREMKPVLIVSSGYTPLWIYGTVPPCHVFRDWPSLYDYLDDVDNCDMAGLQKRWYFFDQDRLHRVTVQRTIKDVLAKMATGSKAMWSVEDLCLAFGINYREVVSC